MTTISESKISRRDQILQCLASMLEHNPGSRITIAKLAKEVGVSEAALYRHFPSKTKMFEGLIVYIEESIFSRVNIILQEETSTVVRCQLILNLLLGFAQNNPGMCRILLGDALAGEEERLRVRVAQFFERVELQLKQVIREAQVRDQQQVQMPVNVAASYMLCVVEGRINQFVRSEFKKLPMKDWDLNWQAIYRSVF
ncbi:MAG: nucleoid occlusion factor SlmA [Saccharospirillaceae bacterium]|nr:nucleoid occlusion factor SlmA [Pseudomonadales bacterium]NRB78514.1 nucleoid occlusion factor SlmA [Saccharospirillaceae bacterium]